MATFVLVHGAWHGGWCYRAVAKILRAAGHDVHTPTMTGCGERSHLLHAGINLDTHIRDVLNVIAWEGLDRVVLCGHSYGGMVITGVADAIPAKVSALVYLDAFVPTKDGESMWDNISDLEKQLFTGSMAADGFTMQPIPAAMFNMKESERAWADSKCVPHPFAGFRQALKLTGKAATIKNRTYVFAQGWDLGGHPTPFKGYHDRLKGDGGWKVHALAGGHDLMIDQPEDVAKILMAAG